MDNHIVAIVVLLQILIGNGFSKESYIILPRSFKFCKDRSNIRDLTITKQISLNFNGAKSLSDFNESKSLRYVCQVVVKPLGRHISIPYNEGVVNFWKLRLKMNFVFDCKSSLTLEYLGEDRVYGSDNTVSIARNDKKTVSQLYTCGDYSPVIINANNLKLSIYWNTEDPASLYSQSLDIELSTYMNFEGNFTVKQSILFLVEIMVLYTIEEERSCILQYGFWCGPIVQVCINAQMHCDEADSCFDGGSDEEGCPPPRNVSHHRLNVRQQRSGWTSYLLWIIICALPLILLFALVLICSQRRHGLDSFPSDVEEDTFHNPDGLDEICNKHVEKRENNCSDLVGGAEGFSICYGGRIHRLSGDPRDSGSLDSCESTNQWNNATQYLAQDSPDSSSVVNTRQETHSNFVELDEGANKTPLIGSIRDVMPKMCRKVLECPGEVSPTLTNESSLNDTSPARVKSQISVLTYCVSERSCGLVRSPSVEDEEISMNELGCRVATRTGPESELHRLAC